MSRRTDNVLPAKCAKCAKPMSTPVVCDYCHALNPSGEGEDYFALLGLRQQFDLSGEEIHQKFLALSRHAHPDFHADQPPEVQALSLRISAKVNDAYRVLSDPSRRGDYLLGLLGGASSAEDKSVPDGFLETMMMMQEEIADAAASEEAGELKRIGQVLQTQHDGLLRRLGELFGQYDEAVVCEATRTDLLREMRRQLNAVSYVKKLLSQTK